MALDALAGAAITALMPEVALADAGYGTDTDFRDGLIESGLPYVVGIQS